MVTKDFKELPPGGEESVDDETDLDHIVGEPVVSGPNVMQGYHGLPEVNAAVLPEEKGKRWFHTADLGYHDEDGSYTVGQNE